MKQSCTMPQAMTAQLLTIVPLVRSMTERKAQGSAKSTEFMPVRPQRRRITHERTSPLTEVSRLRMTMAMR